MPLDPLKIDELVAVAVAAREKARAPYSGFAVGGAVMDAEGRCVGGCNVENASFGLTVCAERVALFRSVVEALGQIVAIAVVVGGEHAVAPCGACRQVMAELCSPDVEVVLAPVDGERQIFTVASLLPEPFSAGDLHPPEA